MQIDVRHASHPEAVRDFDTEALRRHFLVETVFASGEIRLTYSHYDRMVIGGATPLGSGLTLTAPTAIGQETFLAERELGALNIGGAGRIIVDGTNYDLAKYDCLYVGKGAKDIRFESADAANPAKFYLVSTPAHQAHPTVLLTREKARHLTPGEAATANKRSIYQFIHPEVCQSCQLTLGFTMIEPGSVWNTMPAHTHDRRMEAYLYFDLEAEQRVFHFMGEPQQTRHMLVANEQAVISPPWSIHSGAGTKNYSFIWAMAGDNKSFTDMDHIAIADLR
ncbi:5-dehydro-4-deoxy-D-glucuronate isomerase [Rhizobium beringeri]|uniref:4-deoxy-L-threo-5-hexosulose-uronate ketol-isomerase n=1 Tax=Rhizobium leguminosarum TaxID=384 RepID=A0A444HKQ9_RHILE|nr:MULTISPECIES: 5-dehydro-4-deoxy-D-glucuronate isomerase [Rhizobium]MBY5458495.1 5-dehydro-4-deoxy-D-glucuronate isomerase [Rhizobium leguminosarum]NKL63671.1 5-dehydro-4-deoxy-D-glucuronate isomerase [Rhizobium leguminosarum bv. viciae]RWX05919.1 5-dehydro-4-deoxy-D-glucuronate isomerase [Rhizobium leguminosarum]RWX22382.1 5-dehydro-4-deoxy-D-glucuronate isomerase [Rhizobium leguminosarum]TAU45260.1 5-dehydro-4-deoxy-D-glucuronate isomerase [Rhizobium leguminosarum]